MIDYLYGEMDDQEKQEFEQYLQSHPELKKELDELKDTRNLLGSAPEDIPEQKPLIIPSLFTSEESGQKSEKRAGILNLSSAAKTIFAAAASFLIILFGASLSGLQFGQTEHGFYLSFGEAAVPAGTISEEDVVRLIDQIREENAMMMATMIEETADQQNARIEEALNLMNAYYENRRQQDLMLIADGLNQLEEETHFRFRQTDQALGSIIYALSNH